MIKLSVRKCFQSLFTVSENCFLVIKPSDKGILKHYDISLLFSPTETPDKVSMSSHTDRLVQGQTYEINCDVVNVAPVKQLSVHWYKGKLHESPQRVHTDTYDDPSLYPGNKSSVFRGFARKDDHESLIWCEAEMKFGPKLGLLPNRSQPHKMEVLCKNLSWNYCSQVDYVFVSLE